MLSAAFHHVYCQGHAEAFLTWASSLPLLNLMQHTGMEQCFPPCQSVHIELSRDGHLYWWLAGASQRLVPDLKEKIRASQQPRQTQTSPHQMH
jgi:hypothetical protein